MDGTTHGLGQSKRSSDQANGANTPVSLNLAEHSLPKPGKVSSSRSRQSSRCGARTTFRRSFSVLERLGFASMIASTVFHFDLVRRTVISAEPKVHFLDCRTLSDLSFILKTISATGCTWVSLGISQKVVSRIGKVKSTKMVKDVPSGHNHRSQ